MVQSHIVAGTMAPDFSVQTWDGKPLQLSHLRGRPVWLAFFRHVQCPFCNIRLYQMRDLRGTTGLRVQVVAVFQSPASKFSESPAHESAWFPMIADPEEKLYQLYGLGSGLGAMLHPRVGKDLVSAMRRGLMPTPADGTFTRIPADFLIDARGQVTEAYYGKLVSDHIPLELVSRFADTMGVIEK